MAGQPTGLTLDPNESEETAEPVCALLYGAFDNPQATLDNKLQYYNGDSGSNGQTLPSWRSAAARGSSA